MRRTLLGITLLLLGPVLALGQATIPVSGTHVYNNANQLLTGQLLFTVTDASNNAITYTPQGGSPTSATITIPVQNGAVQNVGGFPPQIPNPLTMSPSNTRYRMQVQTTGGATTYYTFPLVQINTASFSYDGYRVPGGVTATGMGMPNVPCQVQAMYNDTTNAAPYPWVCSSLTTDNSIVWSQNPSLSPLCNKGNSQAIANWPDPSGKAGPAFCIASTITYATPGFVYASPGTNQTLPGQIGLVPIGQVCADPSSGCGSGGGGVGNLAYLTVHGTVDGSNTHFTLDSVPNSALQLLLNGQLLNPGTCGANCGYTLVGTDITMTTPPQAGDFLWAYATIGDVTGQVTQVSGASGALSLHGTAVIQTGNDFLINAGGDVNPGAANCPLPYYPTTDPTVSPTGILTDCATKSTQTSQGLNPENISGFPGSNGNILSYFNQVQVDNMKYVNPFIGSETQTQVVSGTTSYQTADGNLQTGSDWYSRYVDMRQLSPGQGGGWDSLVGVQNAQGDNVLRTITTDYRGVTEGFHEGMEIDRIHAAPQNNDPGGHAQILSVDAFGRQNFRLLNTCTSECFWAGSLFGSENLLVNVSKKVSPVGNVIGIQVAPSDSRFVQVTPDATLAGNLNTAFSGATSHTAILVGGADNNVYNTSCPSSIVTNPDIGRTNWYPLNPYATKPDGTLVQSFPAGIGSPAAQCLTFPTSGLTDGTIVGIWGAHDNKEYARVVHVFDANHATVQLNHLHAAGELITWGAGTGWGFSSPAILPKPYFSNTINFQYIDMRAVYPIMSWDGTNLMLWVNSSCCGTELKLGIWNGISPHIAGIFTPTVVGGVVTNIVSNLNDYRADPLGMVTAFAKFPPPSITYGGSGTCSVLPTTHWQSDQARYQLILDSGGSGCPADLSITPQAAYPNPIDLYPTGIISNVRDPAQPAGANWYNAYVTTEALGAPAQWAANDTLEQSMSTNQYFTGNREVSQSAWVLHSGRFGPQFTEKYGLLPNGPGDGPGVLKSVSVYCPSWTCYGDSTTNWGPSGADRKQWYARWTPPIMESIGGNINTYWQLRTPPQGQGFGNRNGGNIFGVNCFKSGEDDGEGVLACEPGNGWYPDYNLIQDFITGGRITMKKTGVVDINALTINGQTACQSNGVGCPSIIHGITLKWQAQPYNYPLNIPYYMGETGYVGTDSGVSYRVPVTCAVDTITASAKLADGGTVPSGEQPQLAVINVTRGDNLWVTNWGTWASTSQQTLVNTNPNYTINTGDQIQVRVFAPSWTTPPGNFNVSATVYCK